MEGDEAAKRAAFMDDFTLISRRIHLLLALPIEKLERLILEAKVHAIGEVGLSTSAAEKGEAPS